MNKPNPHLKIGFFGLYVFLTPPALHEVPEAWFNVWRTYSLSSFAFFKRVTRGSATMFFVSLPLRVAQAISSYN